MLAKYGDWEMDRRVRGKQNQLMSHIRFYYLRSHICNIYLLIISVQKEYFVLDILHCLINVELGTRTVFYQLGNCTFC